MNGIISAILSRSRTVVSTLVLILIAGMAAYVGIPKEADPDVEIPFIYVNMSHEGISPEDAERLLVRPMEQELRSLEGLKEMKANAYEGGANVTLEFEAGSVDTDQALLDVREKVDAAKTKLPDETDDPSVNEVKLSKQDPMLVLNISGSITERAHRRSLAERERDNEGILITNLASFPRAVPGLQPPQLIVAEVVISSDYLKSFVASLRKLLGGELTTYRTLMERARREALLRLVEQARVAGYNAIGNVRIATADIGGSTGRRGSLVLVSVLGSATAYQAAPPPPRF